MKRPLCRLLVNRKSPGFLPDAVVFDGLPGLFTQLELDRLSRFPLSNRRALHRVAIWCHVLDLESHHVAAAQLAVDGQIEHGKVPDAAVDH
jgi:hypothetical protein